MVNVCVCAPYRVKSLKVWGPKIQKIVESIVKEDNNPLVPQFCFYEFDRKYGYEVGRRHRRMLVESSDEVRVYTEKRTKEMEDVITAAKEFGKLIIYYPDFK